MSACCRHTGGRAGHVTEQKCLKQLCFFFFKVFFKMSTERKEFSTAFLSSNCCNPIQEDNCLNFGIESQKQKGGAHGGIRAIHATCPLNITHQTPGTGVRLQVLGRRTQGSPCPCEKQSSHQSPDPEKAHTCQAETPVPSVRCPSGHGKNKCSKTKTALENSRGKLPECGACEFPVGYIISVVNKFTF